MPIAILIVQALLTYGPEAAQAIQKVLSNPAPTQADWDAVFAVATKESFDMYLAAARAKAGLPPVAPAVV